MQTLEHATRSSCQNCTYAAYVRRCLSYLGQSTRDLLNNPVHDDASASLRMFAFVYNWCRSGCEPEIGQRLSTIRAATLERILPPAGNGPRGQGWWYLCALLSVPELVTICRSTRHLVSCRLPLRCLPVGLQHCLWRHDYTSPRWHDSVHYMLNGYLPARCTGGLAFSAVYIILDRKTGC